MFTKLYFVFFFLMAPILLCGIEIGSLNPDALAKAEIGAWKAYYKKDKIALIKSITSLISQQYPLKNPQAWAEIIPPLGFAMYRFGNMPIGATQIDYEREVLPSLTEAYKALGSHLHANWDSKEIALNDLEWWIMRRSPATHSPEKVGKKIAQLYRKIFGNKDGQHFERAGYLRATAARYRDICQFNWNPITENDWQAMRDILLHSYEELDKGIQIQQLPS